MPHKIAILRFPYSSQLGGEELHTIELAQHWLSQGKQVDFWGSCPVLLAEMPKIGVNTHKFWLGRPPVSKFTLLGFSGLYPYLRARAKYLVKRLVAAGTTHVYCLSFTEKLLIADLLPPQIKCVFVEHARIGNWLYQNPWRFRYYSAARQHVVVTVSELMRAALQKQRPNLPVQVVANGIDLDRFRIELPSAESKLLEFAPQLAPVLADKIPLVTQIGRLTDDKGLEQLVAALQQLPRDLDWAVAIVGQGPLREWLAEVIKESSLADRVFLLDFLPQDVVAALLQRTTVLPLLVPVVEPFGLVVLEALAAGAQVLTTKNCGAATVVEGLTLVNPADPSAIAQSLAALLAKPPSRKVQQALAEDFDQEQMWAAYDQLLFS